MAIEIPTLNFAQMKTIEFQELIPGIKIAIPLVIPGFESLPQLPGVTIKNPGGGVVAKGARIPTSLEELQALFGGGNGNGNGNGNGTLAPRGRQYPNTGRPPVANRGGGTSAYRIPAGSGGGETTLDVVGTKEDLELDPGMNELEDLELDGDMLTPIEDDDELMEI